MDPSLGTLSWTSVGGSCVNSRTRVAGLGSSVVSMRTVHFVSYFRARGSVFFTFGCYFGSSNTSKVLSFLWGSHALWYGPTISITLATLHRHSNSFGVDFLASSG